MWKKKSKLFTSIFILLFLLLVSYPQAKAQDFEGDISFANPVFFPTFVPAPVFVDPFFFSFGFSFFANPFFFSFGFPFFFGSPFFFSPFGFNTAVFVPHHSTVIIAPHNSTVIVNPNVNNHVTVSNSFRGSGQVISPNRAFSNTASLGNRTTPFNSTNSGHGFTTLSNTTLSNRRMTSINNRDNFPTGLNSGFQTQTSSRIFGASRFSGDFRGQNHRIPSRFNSGFQTQTGFQRFGATPRFSGGFRGSSFGRAGGFSFGGFGRR